MQVKIALCQLLTTADKALNIQTALAAVRVRKASRPVMRFHLTLRSIITCMGTPMDPSHAWVCPSAVSTCSNPSLGFLRRLRLQTVPS